VTHGKEKYDPTTRDELDKLAQAEWEEACTRALKYAQWRAAKYGWLGVAVDPQDLVHEAIARAYGVGAGGTYRNWNKERYPTLKDLLISIISSMTSHEAEHSERFRNTSLYREDGTLRELEAEALAGGAGPTGVRFPTTPEEEILLAERRESISKELHKIAEGDVDLGMVILCLEDGTCAPREIAEEAGLDRETVYEKLRTLRRKAKRLLKTLR
jgi:DNA-directed RNA polymerase specialized sigma24 family protein